MPLDLTAMVKEVHTEADFLRFARALLANWEDEQKQLPAQPRAHYGERGPNGWENGSIGSFLSGMIRWAEDKDHSQQYNADPDWGLFALMLLAGSRYE